MISIPDGYVLTVLEIVFLMIILVCFFCGALYHFYRVVEIPLTPRKVVLESAVVYRDVSVASKTTSNLYLRIGSVDETYHYVIEASTRDIKHLAFSKSRKLWVAVEPQRNKRFVWGVYDNELTLLISRQEIVGWAVSGNMKKYLIIFILYISCLCLLFWLLRNGIFNRFLAKGIAHENRSN